MGTADYLFLLLAKPVVSGILTRDHLPALSGLTADEVSEIVDRRLIAPSLHDLEACRAAAFGLDAGLEMKTIQRIVRQKAWDYSSALIDLASAAAAQPELPLSEPDVVQCVHAIAGLRPIPLAESKKAA